jgi:ParB family transcriptional regulator, chromosome partitioning protein
MGPMSKRTDAIRSLFTAPQPDALSADNRQNALRRVASGSVRSLRESFSDIERENEDLRQKIASGELMIELDPALIDPSPVRDRFKQDDDPSFETLKASIAQRGQEIPILIREHPTLPGRYQSAYGHRRIRAARELGRTVKAILRTLSDEDLVVAQGVENSTRQDLTFIERAVFAMHLEDAGHDRSIVQEALSIDRAEASKLVSVARSVPPELVEAIGRSPKVGRGRWQALSDALKRPGALKRAQNAATQHDFAEIDSDGRFLAVLSAAAQSDHNRTAAASSQAIVASSGEQIARVQQVGRDLKLTIDRGTKAGFAMFLVEQLPRLFETYVESRQAEDRREV